LGDLAAAALAAALWADVSERHASVKHLLLRLQSAQPPLSDGVRAGASHLALERGAPGRLFRFSQHARQQSSGTGFPASSVPRVMRHPCCELTSVYAVWVVGAALPQPAHRKFPESDSTSPA
jgi:hypothetical protein